MDGIITANENVDKIMTEAAGACDRAVERATRTDDLAARGRVSRNSNAYRKAWAALTGATDAEREAFWNRYMFPAKEA